VNVWDQFGFSPHPRIGDHDDPFAALALQLDAVPPQLRDQLAALAPSLAGLQPADSRCLHRGATIEQHQAFGGLVEIENDY
jgi:hypothetical protein